MSFIPKELETHIDWRASVSPIRAMDDGIDGPDGRELHHALQVAKSVSDNLLEIRKESFPLDGLVAKLGRVERELIDGRGFMRIGALDTTPIPTRAHAALLGHRPASGDPGRRTIRPHDGRRDRSGKEARRSHLARQ